MSANSNPLNLTSEQHQALAAHGRSVSLAAGAGCGKTFVLTERFLSYLDPQVVEPSADLHELVAITFTDAAAREMRERVRSRCYRRLEQATNSGEKQAWNRLIRTLDAARISTIHAFCGALLRSHAAEAEVDPRFETLDPPAAELLRLQTVDNRLRQLLLAGNEKMLQLATHFTLRGLRDHVARLLGEDVQQVVSAWGKASPEQLVDAWQEHFCKQIVPMVMAALLSAEPILQLQTFCRTADVSKASLNEHFDKILRTLDELPNQKEPHQAIIQLRELAKVRGVCTKKDWEDVEQYQRYSDANKAVRELLDKNILRHPLQHAPMLEAAQVGLDLLELVGDVSQHYQRLKQARNVLEFDDLLLQAHQLLTDERYPGIRESLTKSTRLLMVDEFQDTDPLQVSIVKAFCGDDWAQQGLFVVGDFKQSIYRFRGAEPRVSSELRKTLPDRSRLSLTTNFRSQPAVLDFVNTLFYDAFGEQYEPLRPSRPQVATPGSIEFLWALDDGSEPSDEFARRLGKAQRARVREARFIARRLAQLLDSGEPIVYQPDENTGGKPNARALKLGDVAILLRTLSDVAIYEEALREQGLDYYLAGGHAFYAQQEIYDILHLLRAIASSADDLSLAGVLRSPMFALEDETLFWLVQQHGSLNAGLFADALPSRLSDEERAKTARAAATLTELRSQKDHRLVAQLLKQAIALTGYDATLLCEFLGQRKLANVHKLIEQARAIDRTSPGDLNGFITQLSEFVVRTPKEPLATTQSDGDVIRIMTIHHSKGLEFPLVVVPDLSRNSRSNKRLPLFDTQLGPLVPAKDSKTRVGWDIHHFAEQLEEEEERKRLLYVACTRAADYLLLSSSLEDLEKPKSDWLKFLANRFDLQTGQCLTAPPTGIQTPSILVTIEEPDSGRKSIGKSSGVDLEKLLEKTRQLAKAGRGEVPPSVAAIPPDLAARKRFSFSRLSGQLKHQQQPTTAETTTATEALGLGNLVHAVLEHADLKKNDDLQELCLHLAPQHVEGDWRTAAKEAGDMLSKFQASPRAAELAQAKVVRREVEFILGWPGSQQQFEGCFLHGFIDCLYQDPAGNWHILDYKSNRVTENDVHKAAKNYTMQMFVYSLACQQALGVTPVECVLHFLRPSAEVTCNWNDNQRTALTNHIDTAIQSQLS
ncbi:MAG: UvrD-helicase domain-containing protein [Planctomycetes bacterium]|nr:UvrD-helicase domain-containing protein [Planctomycetota bacterium]